MLADAAAIPSGTVNASKLPGAYGIRVMMQHVCRIQCFGVASKVWVGTKAGRRDPASFKASATPSAFKFQVNLNATLRLQQSPVFRWMLDDFRLFLLGQIAKRKPWQSTPLRNKLQAFSFVNESIPKSCWTLTAAFSRQ